MAIYTTIGSVRGCCGHRHRSLETAEECLERDRRGCARHGGYSDRDVVVADDRGVLCHLDGDGDAGEPYYPYGRTSRAADVDDIGGRL